MSSDRAISCLLTALGILSQERPLGILSPALEAVDAYWLFSRCSSAFDAGCVKLRRCGSAEVRPTGIQGLGHRQLSEARGLARLLACSPCALMLGLFLMLWSWHASSLMNYSRYCLHIISAIQAEEVVVGFSAGGWAGGGFGCEDYGGAGDFVVVGAHGVAVGAGYGGG